MSDSLTSSASGVVLRGAGQGPGGTVLLATRREQHDVIIIQGEGAGLGEVADSRTAIATSYVPVGSTTFEVEFAVGFSEGDVVGVLRTPNQDWIDALGMGEWGWTTSSYTIAHERRVVSIDGNTISVDIPLVDSIESAYGGGALFRADLSGRVAQVGIEDLRIDSVYTGATDEEHAWVAVRLRRATNSWVRRVTARHMAYSAVSIDSESSFNTVEEVASLDQISEVTGGRRYAFNIGDGTGNLFQRIYSDESRHDFVSGARTTGPNVWLDAYSNASHSDDGPHHRWATGLLFDNTVSSLLRVQNREDSGSGHGWAGAQTLFWNPLAAGITCDSPLGAMNWAIGAVGSMDEGSWTAAEPFCWWESHNRPVEPRSLYLHQLRDRLGSEAVASVTTSAQREGRIWGQLAAWAGDGRLADVESGAGDAACETGIASGNSCCAASCGRCGGEGCSGLPGGVDACCTSRVRTSGRSCAVFAPPCVVDPEFEPID